MDYKAFDWLKTMLVPSGTTTIFKAQLKIFYLMLGANVLKGLIHLYYAQTFYNGEGSINAISLILISLALVATLRIFPRYIKFGIHFAITATILHVYYRIFNESVGADTIAIQNILMVVVSSFYGLGAIWGVFYTVIACIAPIACNYISFRYTGLQILPGNLNDFYIGINFLVILLSHFYFHRVLFKTIADKDLVNAELEKNAEEKRTFHSVMAHELRTPLNSVIGIASLMIDESGDNKQKEQLDLLKFSAENLLSLINDILDINKLEAGKVELEELNFNCHTLIKSIANSMDTQTKAKAIALVIDVDNAIKQQTYRGDVTRMSQVLYNLVGNAVKFTEHGEVHLSAKILEYQQDRHLIRFKVKDTGIGMSLSQQHTIFKPFVQATKHTNRKFGGTGLGLYIVKQLVEMFGSDVYLESEPNKGTMIYFDIWLTQVTKENPSVNEPQQNAESRLEKLSVLLVEDNMINIYFMKQLFIRWNIKADFAENGALAVGRVQNNKYDVILMDMQMPVMDGIEATLMIRSLADSEKANTPVIALTASITNEIKEEILRSGMNDYLQKPFELADLKSKLLKFVPTAQLEPPALKQRTRAVEL